LSGYIKPQGDKHKGYHYEVVSYEEYEQLQTRIAKVIDQLLENLRQQPSGSPVAQSNIEPPKRKRDRPLGGAAQQPTAGI
jgi:hypothetical protein